MLPLGNNIKKNYNYSLDQSHEAQLLHDLNFPSAKHWPFLTHKPAFVPDKITRHYSFTSQIKSFFNDAITFAFFSVRCIWSCPFYYFHHFVGELFSYFGLHLIFNYTITDSRSIRLLRQSFGSNALHLDPMQDFRHDSNSDTWQCHETKTDCFFN